MATSLSRGVEINPETQPSSAGKSAKRSAKFYLSILLGAVLIAATGIAGVRFLTTKLPQDGYVHFQLNPNRATQLSETYLNQLAESGGLFADKQVTAGSVRYALADLDSDSDPELIIGGVGRDGQGYLRIFGASFSKDKKTPVEIVEFSGLIELGKLASHNLSDSITTNTEGGLNICASPADSNGYCPIRNQLILQSNQPVIIENNSAKTTVLKLTWAELSDNSQLDDLNKYARFLVKMPDNQSLASGFNYQLDHLAQLSFPLGEYDHPILEKFDNPTSYAVADLNGDHCPELLIASNITAPDLPSKDTIAQTNYLQRVSVISYDPKTGRMFIADPKTTNLIIGTNLIGGFKTVLATPHNSEIAGIYLISENRSHLISLNGGSLISKPVAATDKISIGQGNNELFWSKLDSRAELDKLANIRTKSSLKLAEPPAVESNKVSEDQLKQKIAQAESAGSVVASGTLIYVTGCHDVIEIQKQINDFNPGKNVVRKNNVSYRFCRDMDYYGPYATGIDYSYTLLVLDQKTSISARQSRGSTKVETRQASIYSIADQRSKELLGYENHRVTVAIPNSSAQNFWLSGTDIPLNQPRISDFTVLS